MNYQDAKRKLEDAGYAGEPTPEALKQAGWDADESIRETKAVGLSQPLFTEDEMKTAAAALHEEMKANSLPAQILPMVKTLLGGIAKAGLLALMLCTLLCSGCSYTQAARTNDDTERLAVSYAAKTATRQAAQISDYRRTARAEADKLTNDAITAEKKRTDETPQQMADNCVALANIKADHYAKIEANCIELQRQFDSDRTDVIQLTRKTSELREYFKGQNDTGQLVQETSKQLIEALGAFKKGGGK